MIILASASPARARLMTEWGYTFQISPTNFDEDSIKGTISDPKTLVETLAFNKASSLRSTVSAQTTILAADTIVYFNHQVIGKPLDREDARRIISLLSGQTHQVWTGVCLLNPHHQFSEVASVTFKPMTNAEIETYLDTNDWVEKAGAYQVQKAIKPFVDSIDGDINTVIGLPSHTQQLL